MRASTSSLPRPIHIEREPTPWQSRAHVLDLCALRTGTNGKERDFNDLARAQKGTAFDNCSLIRSEEHKSELQSLKRNSYAGFCLKKQNRQNTLFHSKIIK